MKSDKELDRKLRNRHDTRAAQLLEMMGGAADKGMDFFKRVNSNGGLESLLFGPVVQVGSVTIVLPFFTYAQLSSPPLLLAIPYTDVVDCA